MTTGIRVMDRGANRVLEYGLRAVRDPDLVPDFVRALPACTDGSIAAFDADGTLWTDDVADDFTTWMIGRGEVPGDGWAEYMRIYRDDPPAGCRHLLTLYEGKDIGVVRERVEHWWLHHAKRRWILEVVEALHHVARKGYGLWIVSGTPTDFLLPLERMFGVERIVGMDFELEDGIVTGRHAGISCAGQGKAEKLLQLAGGRRVALCCGNGSLDGPMMEIAGQAWSVYPDPAFEAFSHARGWPVLRRPSGFVEEEKFL
ncbi:MAG: haloacid dehalogenase-like hydrolase [Deltaproteobacteria bacterium]|nr:haloacid dehalogenase-like hydrolase [Deltaproteobacteria bacterium]